jgi:hypothetical protein
VLIAHLRLYTVCVAASHLLITYLSIAAMQCNLCDNSGLLRMLLRQGSSRDARAPSPNLPQSEEQDLNEKAKYTSICTI